jgi:hypothetical protein
MLMRISHFGFLAVLTAVNLPGSAKAWDGCYYHPCYPRYNYYPGDFGYGYRPYYYPNYYTGCRWCGGYGDGYGPYGGYGGYRRHYSYFRYEEWDSLDR